jgi:hypothetical protein
MVTHKSVWITSCLLAGLVLLNLMEVPVAFSQNKYPMGSLLRCTRDQPLIQALEEMVGSSGEYALDQIVKKPVRVIFKDLGTLSRKLKSFDALSWLSVDGQQVIFISDRHRTAPPEALAAIIAHEALHNDFHNSITEEITGWQKEAEVWIEKKRQNPELAEIPAGAFPLVDRLNRIEQEYRRGNLVQFVRNNPGYAGLPETSPGFETYPQPIVTHFHPHGEEHVHD